MNGEIEEKKVLLVTVVILLLGFFASNFAYTGLHHTGNIPELGVASLGIKEIDPNTYTCLDYYAALSHFNSGKFRTTYDINGDGALDLGDLNSIKSFALEKPCKISDECPYEGFKTCGLREDIIRICVEDEFGNLVFENNKCDNGKVCLWAGAEGREFKPTMRAGGLLKGESYRGNAYC